MRWQVEKAGGLLGVTSRGLLILLILLLIIVLMFIIIIVLAAMWPRNYNEKPPYVCNTPSCLRAAAQVRLFFFFFFLIGWLISLFTSRKSKSKKRCHVVVIIASLICKSSEKFFDGFRPRWVPSRSLSPEPKAAEALTRIAAPCAKNPTGRFIWCLHLAELILFLVTYLWSARRGFPL